MNEPGSSLGSRTRAVSMSAEMMEYVTSIFSRDGSIVPTQILTVGMGTIMDAREVGMTEGGSGRVGPVLAGRGQHIQ